MNGLQDYDDLKDPSEVGEDEEEITTVPRGQMAPAVGTDDSRTRLKNYLESQMKTADRRASPEAMAQQGERFAASSDNANLGALLMNSASKFGTIDGKSPDTSGFDRFTQQGLSNQKEYLARNDSYEKNRRDDEYRRLKVMQYLASEKEKKEQSGAKNAMAQTNFDRNLEFKNKALGVRQEMANEARASRKSTEQANKPPREDQKILDSLAGVAASRTSTAALLEERLKKYRAAVAAGDKNEAIKEGQQMFKILNSPDNPDAVSTDEANRLGSFLKKKIFNLMEPGSMFGRDMDMFDTQVANTINSVRDAARSNLLQIENMKSGKGLELKNVPLIPKSGKEGTATAAPGKSVSTKQYSPSRNQTKIVYSDGSEEVVDGKR